MAVAVREGHDASHHLVGHLDGRGDRVEGDLREQLASFRFSGALAAEILTPLSTLIKVDVRKYFDFATMPKLKAAVDAYAKSFA